MSVSQKYDELYASAGEVTPPQVPFLEEATRYAPQGNVLDIGAGVGQNTTYFLERGYAVVALDFSEKSIEYLGKMNDPLLSVRHADIRDMSINEEYAIILNTYVLQHFSQDERTELIQKQKAHTIPGGVHLLAAFIDSNGPMQTEYGGYPLYLMGKKELQEHYADWHILHEKYEHTQPAKEGVKPAADEKEILLVQKPG